MSSTDLPESGANSSSSFNIAAANGMENTYPTRVNYLDAKDCGASCFNVQTCPPLSSWVEVLNSTGLALGRPIPSGRKFSTSTQTAQELRDSSPKLKISGFSRSEL